MASKVKAILTSLLLNVSLLADGPQNPSAASTSAKVQAQSTSAFEFNTVLMQSTFKLEGAAGGGRITVGTGFILGRALKSDPSKALYVLVTARHVFEGITGDFATVYFRKRSGTDSFEKLLSTIRLRTNGINNYVTHSIADVAAMFVPVPRGAEFPLIDSSFLTTDERLRNLEIHPGDQLFCLGYPLSVEANEAGFPVLRSGTIASYPITPMKDVKKISFDFTVFPGNSGGPVYYNYETRKKADGQLTTSDAYRSIIGLVVEQVFSTPGFGHEPIRLGVIVPAPFISETISLLPEP